MIFDNSNGLRVNEGQVVQEAILFERPGLQVSEQGQDVSFDKRTRMKIQ